MTAYCTFCPQQWWYIVLHAVLMSASWATGADCLHFLCTRGRLGGGRGLANRWVDGGRGFCLVQGPLVRMRALRGCSGWSA